MNILQPFVLIFAATWVVHGTSDTWCYIAVLGILYLLCSISLLHLLLICVIRNITRVIDMALSFEVCLSESRVSDFLWLPQHPAREDAVLLLGD